MTTITPAPVHQTVLNMSIQPFDLIAIKPPSYIQQEQQPKRKSYASSFSSEEDESEGDDHYHQTEEHKFWQVHASTTIITPQMDYIADMTFMPPPSTKRRTTNNNKKMISLAAQVHDLLGSTLDEVDQEIEKEWEKSRLKLRKSLMAPATISLYRK